MLIVSGIADMVETDFPHSSSWARLSKYASLIPQYRYSEFRLRLDSEGSRLRGRMTFGTGMASDYSRQNTGAELVGRTGRISGAPALNSGAGQCDASHLESTNLKLAAACCCSRSVELDTCKLLSNLRHLEKDRIVQPDVRK